MTGHGKINQRTLRKLRSLSTRSMRRAGEALTALLNHPVRMEVSGVYRLAADALPDWAAEAGTEGLAGLRIQISGESGGEMVLLFPRRTIYKMLRALLRRPEGERPLSVKEQSAIQEVGNILASSFLSELGDLLGRRLLHSPPELHLANIPQLIQEAVETVKDQGSEVLVVQGLFEDLEQEITGRFFVVPEMASLHAMIHQAGDGGCRP